jgi:Tol biopolymer transport system component
MRSHRALATLCVLLLAACGPSATADPQPTRTSSAIASAAPSQASAPSPVRSAESSPSPIAVLPDEPWIVYQYWNGRSDLRLVRPDGTGDHALFADQPMEQWHPDWAPDGTRIAFEMGGEIWIAGVDGAGARRVADCTTPCRDLNQPAWSPDGSEVAFTRIDLVDGQNPGSIVQAVNVSTGAVRDLLRTTGAVYANGARWSPDGTALVVQLDRYLDTGNDTSRITGTEVAVVDLTKTKATPRPLTDWPTFATYPDWSPDGTRIVFTTYDLGARDGGSFDDPAPPSDLYTIRPDGSGLAQLTHNEHGTGLVRNGTASGPLSTQPTWAPDGRSIIFVQVDGPTWPGWTMATIDADGTGLAPATTSGFMRGTHPRLRPNTATAAGD